MSIEHTDADVYVQGNSSSTLNQAAAIRVLFRVVIVITLAFLFYRSTPTPQTTRYATFGLAVAGEGFDLLEWEANALRQKIGAAIAQPIEDIPPSEQVELVRTYLERAQEIGRINADLAARASGLDPLDDTRTRDELEQDLIQLRARQSEIRPAVEQIIQHQIASSLLARGFGIVGLPWPPVQFTFTEPPKKLVVSPRDRVATIYSRMLAPSILLGEIEAAEGQIDDQRNASAYITDIGGLGAFPTMVVDRAPLSWVLSTVAHEWVHNYLVFFPLGWNYFANQDMTTINESVAEIVGNEIGEIALQTYYGEPMPSAGGSQRLEVPPEPAPFDFRAAMRETRLEVDRLLALGQVEEAESYMDARRQLFIEEGYPLRVLNQAYFAFHGSYGTSPASTSPIGPKLERLRELMPDIKTFLQTVRWFTSVDDLDEALAEWEMRR